MLYVYRAYVASAYQMVARPILSSSVLFVMGGLHISIGRALIGVIAELFTGISGFDGRIQTHTAVYQADSMSPLLILMRIGVLLEVWPVG
ncbi:hypothetical protein [Nocardia macrotermitis]|uniref:Uncharacterized protein n=1 Tax=Nocardia macrotermitis TaxID=2585198 RepID=A0A7K0D1Y9_9NOCA|nr:hypothetical protein [Nocardia macrotermitis]MQY19671.1 hypothetical protein [Nocardia macrotermitis]